MSKEAFIDMVNELAGPSPNTVDQAFPAVVGVLRVIIANRIDGTKDANERALYRRRMDAIEAAFETYKELIGVPHTSQIDGLRKGYR